MESEEDRNPPSPVTQIPPHRAARIRSTPRVASCGSQRQAFALGIALIGLLVFSSTALGIDGPSPHGNQSGSLPLTVDAAMQPNAPSPTDVVRNALAWPFSRNSIWNLPIGASAVYVPAGIKKPTDYGMTTDVDVLVLTPGAPVTPVYYNGDAWDGGSRCDVQGGVLFSAPIPPNFVVPGAGSGNPDGSTPNYATAILAADNHTLIQGQPMARCTADGNVTMWWSQENESLFGTGTSGGHGGSMLSSIGGTIRLGELVPGGAIHHAMKVNLHGAEDYYYDNVTGGFRWPATTADGDASGSYHGTVPALREGSLLALPPSVDVNAMGLETDPAKILARAFQDYGAYTVDDAAWSTYAICTERSPAGRVDSEFESAWGFPINEPSLDAPWSRDMNRIFGALNVVDNWNFATWLLAAASNGTLGAGLGVPRVSWAPYFDPNPDMIAPVSTASLSGTAGPADWFLSPVQVTLNASDSGSGVAAIYDRIDGGNWQPYTSPVTVGVDGVHAVEYFATDASSNYETIHTATFKVDTVGPASSAVLSGTSGSGNWFRSPVQVPVSASDAGSGVSAIHVRSDGGPWGTYTGPLSIPTDGVHTVDSYGTDFVGHDGPIHSTAFGIDTIAPSTSLQPDKLPDARGWYASPLGVTLSAADATSGVQSISVRIDSGTWVTYTTPIFLAGRGTHQLEYFATDLAGNVEAVQTRSFTLLGPWFPPIRSAKGGPPEPGLTLPEQVQVSLSIPPLSAVGFIVVIAGLFLLNREKMEWLQRTRSPSTGRSPARSRLSWLAPFRLF